jgi:hypothetical protein
MFYHGEIDGVLWSYMVDGPIGDDWSRYCALVQRGIDRILAGERTASLCILYRSIWPQKGERDLVKAVMCQAKGAPAELAVHALVSDNRLHRTSLRVFSIIRGKLGAEKVFSRPRPAVVWLAELGFEITPGALGAEVRRAVPSELLWEELFRVDTLPL